MRELSSLALSRQPSSSGSKLRYGRGDRRGLDPPAPAPAPESSDGSMSPSEADCGPRSSRRGEPFASRGRRVDDDAWRTRVDRLKYSTLFHLVYREKCGG